MRFSPPTKPCTRDVTTFAAPTAFCSDATRDASSVNPASGSPHGSAPHTTNSTSGISTSRTVRTPVTERAIRLARASKLLRRTSSKRLVAASHLVRVAGNEPPRRPQVLLNYSLSDNRKRKVHFLWRSNFTFSLPRGGFLAQDYPIIRAVLWHQGHAFSFCEICF